MRHETVFVTRSDIKLPAACGQDTPATGVDQTRHVVSGHRMAYRAPFASLSGALLSHLPQSNNSRKKEEATGMEFPEECCVLTQHNCPVLTGFGQVGSMSCMFTVCMPQ